MQGVATLATFFDDNSTLLGCHVAILVRHLSL
jgi:hypothetical protein